MAKCPKCQSKAYVGLLEVRCSNELCDLFDVREATEPELKFDMSAMPREFWNWGLS